jgi:uncharacterized protein YggE
VTQPYLAAALLLLAPSFASAQQAPTEPFITTTGEGVVQAVPDRAWVSISAESRASSPREAQRRNAEAMAPVHEKLRGTGIPADAIRTTSYDLQQEWDFVNNRRVSRGYVARNTIEVRVDAVDRLGELLEIAVGSGATSVGGIRFDVKERAKLEREALRLAVADARAKADAAAAGASLTVDRVIRLEEQGVVTKGPMPFAAAAREALQSDAPPIAIGVTEIQSRVTLTVAIK